MREQMLLLLFCILVAAGCFGGAVWLVATGQIPSMDGLFLLMVFLWWGAIFSYMVHDIWKTLRNPRGTRSSRAGTSQSSSQSAGSPEIAEVPATDEAEQTAEVVICR
jgi:ABC-type branched-subunit amino acid transport system permease subunit